MSKVYFASAHTSKLTSEDTLPPKFKRLLKGLWFGRAMKDKVVCIKMHTGGGVGYTTIHPLLVRVLVEAVKEAGGRPFITGGIGWSTDAYRRGYTQETLGAPIYPAAGVTDKYYYEVPIDFRSLDVCQVCGDIADSDVLITFSHGKGHGHCGYGGVIKNIAMGCVTGKTRAQIHRLMDTGFKWDEKLCQHCNLCVENCPTGTARFNKDQQFTIFLHNCTYCMHCVEACPGQAIKIEMSTYLMFQRGMALATKATLGFFKPSQVFHITVLLDVTPFCDCWGFSTPSLVPDIGIMASRDLVALEQASLDAIKVSDYIPGSLPEQLKMSKKGRHLFERIHHKNPYVQVEAAAELGLGSREYELVDVP
jgi:uncharacterized Fe-S center protein